eukprot:CAMPEP_0113585550 /NCGR_PEP_ID=MMETSP0015_2-20120614/33764_1 /TAXON_ID=2838 /ORGANISM="Odontella" /LENGTH=108 /DNA_ID=CAMNT_0000490809 /DNA_START=287 /DNA_END=613 /DNA_ORIENTATION=+ /assembly_acc=CAM_ASM_000160
MYGGYSVIIVLSTTFNFVATSAAGLAHYVAWVVTLLWTGVANYFILKKLWSFGGKSVDRKGGKEGMTEKKKKRRRRKKKKGVNDEWDIESVGACRRKEALTSRRAVVI